MSTTQEALLDAGPGAGDHFEGEVRVEYVRWCSEDGKFAVVDLTMEDGTPLCAVGPLGHLEDGSRARLSGIFEVHERHGLQLAAREAEPLDPAGIDGARRYLKSLPGIGAKRADELIDRHGEELFEAIDRDPEAAFAALKGVNEDKARVAAEEWANRRAERRLYALLAPHGLSRHVGELIAIHGIHAAEAIREDPYSLTEVSGIGFRSADSLAVASGVDPGSPRRMRAAATHVLREAEQRGHTHLPLTDLLETLRSLLGAEPSMGQISGAPELVVDGTLVYREWTWRAERWLGANLAGAARAMPARVAPSQRSARQVHSR